MVGTVEAIFALGCGVALRITIKLFWVIALGETAPAGTWKTSDEWITNVIDWLVALPWVDGVTEALSLAGVVALLEQLETIHLSLKFMIKND